MIWWIENVARPYMFFLEEWPLAVMFLVSLACCGIMGKIYHPKSFEDWEDYIFPILLITVATVVVPIMSVGIVLILPIILWGFVAASVGGLVFWAAQKNFWIKRNKK